MLDGINVVCHALDPLKWFSSPELLGVDGFPLEVMEDTGEVLGRPRKAKYKGLTFSVSPSKNGGVRCWLDGSIHKYKNDGAYNYDRFTFTDIRNVVAELQARFSIDPNTTYLHGLEIGVNLVFDSHSQVVRAIKSAISHKGKEYVSLFPHSSLLGKVCSRADFKIKIYDKGKQSSLEQHILRFEVSFPRMRALLGYNLETLADLTNPKKVFALVEVLCDALNHTVFIDPYAETSLLNQREKLVLETFRQSERWVNLDFEQRRSKREQIERVLEKCNAFNVRADLQKRVLEEWEELKNTALKAEILPMFAPIFEPKEAVEKPMFVSLEYVGTNMGFTLSDEPTPNPLIQPIQKRVCCSCGSDISHQRPQSRFCSEKYKGGAAKKCRNKDSNKRKTLKIKIMKAQTENRYLRITYKKDGETYTDVLHSSEIVVSREWLDTVVRVETVPFYSSDEKECFYGKDAKAVLEQLTRENSPDVWTE